MLRFRGPQRVVEAQLLRRWDGYILTAGCPPQSASQHLPLPPSDERDNVCGYPLHRQRITAILQSRLTRQHKLE